MDEDGQSGDNDGQQRKQLGATEPDVLGNNVNDNQSVIKAEEQEEMSSLMELFELLQGGITNFANLDISNYPLHSEEKPGLNLIRDLLRGQASFPSSGSNSSMNSSFNLPELVVKEILKNVSDQETMLACRLVGVQWNNVIKDTLQLMRKITFPVWHPKPFLDLDIVKQGKVKSICLKFLPLDSCFTNQFLIVMSNSIEKVVFDLETTSLTDQFGVFKLILQQCTSLQELEIKHSNNHLLGHIGKTIEIASAKKLKIITVNVDDFRREDPIGLSTLLLKLPCLVEICLNGSFTTRNSNAFGKVLTAVENYLKNYGAALKLKKLALYNPDQVGFHEILVSLLILCGKYKTTIHTPILNLNELLEQTESPVLEMSLLQQRPLFTAVLDSGILTFSWPPLTNLDRLDSLKIRNLRLDLKQDRFVRLDFLTTIDGLEELVFNGNPYSHQDFQVSSTALHDLLLHSGLLCLMKLEINYDVFDSFSLFHWPQYSPNLRELQIAKCKFTPKYVIWWFSALKSLTNLTLSELVNLEDIMFTTPSRPPFEIDGSLSLIPAICCFKSLEYLTIRDCPKLTNECLINGIAKCKTLKKLSVISCKRIITEE